MNVTVAILCAAWCSTCREFREVIERIAPRRPELRFAWFDIEDDSELCGDIDVETFPTLAVFRGETALYFGPTLPQEQLVLRLLDEMSAPTRAPLPSPPDALGLLAAGIASRASPG